MLLETPGEHAVFGSGFISANNDDPTAANFWTFMRDVRLIAHGPSPGMSCPGSCLATTLSAPM
jgi:hypothetical protein